LTGTRYYQGLSDKKMNKILIADDNKYSREMLVRYFEMNDFEAISAVNGKEAILKEELMRPDLVVLDIQMPEMNGLEACKIIREKRRGVDYVPIIFLSGLITKEIVIEGLESGADDYMKKPFEPLELLTRVNNLIKTKDFILQVDLLENTMFALVKSIETRDFYTAGHSRRVSQISVSIGKELGFSEKEIEILKKSSLLHDIGKIGISDKILNKPCELTKEEVKFMREHPVKGEEICKVLRLDPKVHDIILYHHEKLDGKGYPYGLKGNEIGKLIRIVTVADMYDALTTNRPYRTAKSNSEAISILIEEAEEGKLDITIIDTLVLCKSASRLMKADIRNN